METTYRLGWGRRSKSKLESLLLTGTKIVASQSKMKYLNPGVFSRLLQHRLVMGRASFLN